MRRLVVLGLMFYSTMVSGLSWETPVGMTHQGEPLEVRIEMMDLEPISPSQLFPLLASESAFTERGIERPERLLGLTYAIDRSDDRVDLVIRSATAWTQPELTTLVEVFSPDGSILIPVSLEIIEKPGQSSITQIDQNLVGEAPLRETLTMTEIKQSSQSLVQKKTILVTLDGSTLWRLASRVQTGATSIEQVVMALYDENPDAFEYNNINALAKGKTLRVPNSKRMLRESPVESKKRFDAHMKTPKADFSRKLKGEGPLSEQNNQEIKSDNYQSIDDRNDQILRESMPRGKSEAKAKVLISEGMETPVMQSEVIVTVLPEENILFDKIIALEVKIDQIGAKIEAVANAKIDKMGAKIEASTNAKITEFISAAEVPAMKVDPISIILPEVTALLGKIDTLEKKLYQVGEKVKNMTEVSSEIKPESDDSKSFGNLIESEINIDIDIKKWMPSVEEAETIFLTALIQTEEWLTAQTDVVEFFGTERGKIILLLIIILISVLLLLRLYGRQSQAVSQSTHQPSSVDSSAKGSQSMINELSSPLNPENQNADEALESAVERLKAKIEDPAKQQEAEELYSGGDDSLIEAFSADALNENPGWGEDPDDEADVAAHQLELAQNYLAMGMTQTAMDLLERVSVSPDRSSAAKASALLDVHRG